MLFNKRHFSILFFTFATNLPNMRKMSYILIVIALNILAATNVKANNYHASNISIIKTGKTYVIKGHNILRGDTITIPKNCILKFEDGIIEGNGVIIGNGSLISASLHRIFGNNITLSGNWNVSEVYPEWFGAVGNGVSDDTKAFERAASLKRPLTLSNKVYRLSRRIVVHSSINGNGATIHADITNTQKSVFDFVRVKNFHIQGVNIISNARGISIRGCKEFTVKDLTFNTRYYSLELGGNGYEYLENFTISSIRFKNDINNLNADGIHIYDGTRNGFINKLTGTTGDDFIALNAFEHYERSDKPLTIENLVFERCEMDETCPLGLRVYSHNNIPIRNITFKKCRFHVTYGKTARATPCVRFMTTITFSHPKDEGANPAWRLPIEKIYFEKCSFKTSSDKTPTIIIQDTDGDITFKQCNWINNAPRNAIALHNNNITLKLDRCNISGGIQGWQWKIGNNGVNRVSLYRCKFEYPLGKGFAPIAFNHDYAYGSKNYFIVDNPKIPHETKFDKKGYKGVIGYIGEKEYIGDNILFFDLKVKNCPNLSLSTSNAIIDIQAKSSKDFKWNGKPLKSSYNSTEK